MAFNISYIYRAVDKFTPVANKIKRSVAGITKKVKSSTLAIKKMGTSLKKLAKSKGFLVVTAAFALGIREYARFETALLGVAKTANIAVGPELDELGNKFTALSLKIPVSAKELLNLGQAAAQLGVEGKDNILNFATVMGKLSRATNVAGEEGAAQLARLIKITGGSTAEVENFASALVELGNTTAATEGEILQFGTQLAGAGALYGITGTQALGLAAAMRSLGIQSEVGSSVVGRSLGIINKAVQRGGSELKNIAFLTGIAGKDLKKAFSEDAINVIARLGAGLQRMKDEGKDVAGALALLGLEGIRDIRVLGSLAKNSGLVNEKLAQSARAFRENIALQKEFDIQATSLANKLSLLLNNFAKIAKQVGIIFRPVMDVMIFELTMLSNILSIVLDKIIKFTGLGGLETESSKIRDAAAAEVAAQEVKSLTRFEGNLNINAPPGVVKDMSTKVSGGVGNLGINMTNITGAAL